MGSTMKEELGGLEPVQRRALRGSSEACGERLTSSGTLRWGKGELNEEAEFNSCAERLLGPSSVLSPAGKGRLDALPSGI